MLNITRKYVRYVTDFLTNDEASVEELRGELLDYLVAALVELDSAVDQNTHTGKVVTEVLSIVPDDVVDRVNEWYFGDAQEKHIGDKADNNQ